MANVYVFRKFIDIILFISIVCELLLYPSISHFLLCVNSISMWIIFSTIMLTKRNFELHPLSSFMILGFALCFIVLPIPSTLLELKPVTYNLRSPFDCFLHIDLCLIAFLIAFKIYEKTLTGNLFRYFLGKMPFFEPFSKVEFIVFAICALAFNIISILFFGRWHDENSQIDDMPTVLSIFSSTSIFLYIPALLLFPKYHLLSWLVSSKKAISLCVVFAVCLFILGMATNVRTFSVNFLCLIGVLFFFGYLTDILPITFKGKYIFLICLCIWFFTGPFKNISTAMVSVRGEKMNLTGLELLEKTIDAYGNKKLLMKNRQLQDEIAFGTQEWNEGYLSNDMLGRFCSVKIFDESIYFAGKAGYENSKMQDDYKRQLIAMLPERICSFLGMSHVEREHYKGYSETDFLVSVANHSGAGLGSFKIGSLSGLGLALFGYWYIFIVILLFIPIFYLIDSTIEFDENGKFYLSPWAAINLFMIFYFTSCGHNYHTEVRFLMRAFWESIMWYLLLRTIVRKICKQKIM